MTRARQASQPVADPRALASLYRQESEFVRTLVRRFGARESDLEDLAHEVFLAASKSLPRFDARRSVRPWLTGIAFRVVSDYRRLARHEREVPGEAEWFVDPTPTPLEVAAGAQYRRLVHHALNGVAFERRAVLVMHEVEELPMSQVARMLAMPEGTAWSRLRQAKVEFTTAVRELDT